MHDKIVTHVSLGGLTVGSAVVLVLRGPTHEFGGGWWAASVTALAEALFIAGVLGVTVDRLLKAVLVREVARLALRAMFGANSPQEYVNNLQACPQSIQLVHLRQGWAITLDWHRRGEVLVVGVESDLDSVNVSSTDWESKNTWMTHSALGDKRSRVDNYRMSVHIPSRGNRADLIDARSFTSAELAHATMTEPNGSVQIMGERSRIAFGAAKCTTPLNDSWHYISASVRKYPVGHRCTVSRHDDPDRRRGLRRSRGGPPSGWRKGLDQAG